MGRSTLVEGSVSVARSLLGRLLVRETSEGRIVARIVETEAYRHDDPASHTYGGRTLRNAAMFEQPGTAYVYRSYGIHWCMNVTAEPVGVGAAVLLRAASLVEGETIVRRLRAGRQPTTHLLRGPGNLCAGLDVDGPRHDGLDLLDASGDLSLARDAWQPCVEDIVDGPRVGVRLAADVPWRFWLRGVPEVSAYRRSPRADAPGRAPASGSPSRR